MMDRHECIELFKEKGNYFSFKASNFDILDQLDVDELADEENIDLTTPLLNEIFLYSLIARYLDVFYLEGLAGDSRAQFYADADKISNACFFYINTLVDDRANHPTIIRYKALTDGTDCYDIPSQLPC